MAKLISGMLLLLLLQACSTGGPAGLFRKRSPHELYAQKLADAGLDRSVMGAQWIGTSQKSLLNPLSVSIPYQETGYFSAQEVKAVTVHFKAQRGEKLNISLTRKPVSFKIYLDLWEYSNEREPSLLAFADTSAAGLSFDADNQTDFVLRLQPELLSGGEYTLTIEKGPILAYPVSNPHTNRIESFWGAGRDENSRRHEGIDMFSAFRTPVVAAASGTIQGGTENNLGGKVVFLHPEGKNYTLYYAHLDSQLVKPGQAVKTGDTLGLMGNTGNAKNGPPHLHFGIYTSSGAIDPLPFVSLKKEYPAKITAAPGRLGISMVANRNTRLYADDKLQLEETALPASTPVLAEAMTAGLYKIRLPDNTAGFIAAKNVSPALPGKNYGLKSASRLYDQPDTLAAAKAILQAGTVVSPVGKFKAFRLVKLPEGMTGWIKSD